MLADRGKAQFDSTKQILVDTRTRSWYGVELKNFIGPLMSMRKQLKKEKTITAHSMQDAIKLIINTLWGDITSAYFELSNVVCSERKEIVTSAIGTSVWLMSKPLCTYLSITDGGPYSLMNVAFLKSNQKKPSFNVLSTYYNYKNHPSIRLGPLENINWANAFENNISFPQEPFLNADVYALNHIKQFWSNYNISINFALEHKPDNFFIAGSYMLKAHYVFKIFDQNTSTYTKILYKIRGFREEKSIKFLNPIFNILYWLEYRYNTKK